MYGFQGGCPSWRIIPVSKWLITMVSFRPLSRVVPLPNGFFMAYKMVVINLLTTYDTWDEPPSCLPCGFFLLAWSVSQPRNFSSSKRHLDPCHVAYLAGTIQLQRRKLPGGTLWLSGLFWWKKKTSIKTRSKFQSKQESFGFQVFENQPWLC